jgi:heme-degrading monooxygenase HmoA
MIARAWRGSATVEGAERYAVHFRDSVLPSLRALDGFRVGYLMRREVDGVVEIRVLTVWASLEAVRAFAGDDLTTAVVEPAARAALTSYDTTVDIYEVTEHS